MGSKKILVIGSIPPPIGGVTVHVENLISFLKNNNYDFSFFDTKSLNPFLFFRLFFSSNIIHCHLCNQFLVFLIGLICFIFRKESILTRHGNVFSNSFFRSIFMNLSFRLYSVPITLNPRSYSYSKALNRHTKLSSAFFIPTNISPDSQTNDYFFDLKKKYKHLASTNAYKLSFTHDGNEIYGIIELIELFARLPDLCLVVSNSSSDYRQYADSLHVTIPSNVVFYEKEHRCNDIYSYFDIMIRNTRTDGDSISIREALLKGLTVFATDVVDRPEGVITYHNIDQLFSYLNDFDSIKQKSSLTKPTTERDLHKIYNAFFRLH